MGPDAVARSKPASVRWIPVTPGTRPDDGALGEQLSRDGLGDLAVVDDRGGGRVDRRIAAACGSISRSSSLSRSRSPSTPLAVPRSKSVWSRGSSASEVATITLPIGSTRIPCSAQKAFISRAPSTQSRALWEPGL